MKLYGMLNFAIYLVLLLTGVAADGAENTAINNWEGAFTLDSNGGKNGNPALKIIDDSPNSGVFAITGFIPLNPQSDYELSGWCRTNGKVTSGSAIYLQVCDAAGETLKHFETVKTKSADWVKLFCAIPSTEIPKKAAKARIILQPAVGLAVETGTAWFDDIVFYPRAKSSPSPEGKEIGDGLFLKASSTMTPREFNAPSMMIDNSLESSWQPIIGDKHPWLELSWRDSNKLAALLLKPGKCTLNTVTLLYWDDAGQQWLNAGNANPERSGDYLKLELGKVPVTRKLKLQIDDFSGNLEICDLKLIAIPPVEENWNASWIWHTAERVEYVNRYFRKKFLIEGKIEKAYLQGTGDDSAVFYINGKHIQSNLDWNHPTCNEISKYLTQGENVIAVENRQYRYEAGILCEVDVNYTSGKNQKIITDNSWVSAPVPATGWMNAGFNDASWIKSVLLGIPPNGAWGKVPYVLNSPRHKIILSATPLPSRLETNQTFKLDFELAPQAKLSQKYPVYLCISRNNRVFLKQQIDDGSILANGQAGEKKLLSTEIKLNRALYPGDYEFSLHVPFCIVKLGSNEWRQTVTVENNNRPEMSNAEIKPLNSIPTLHINGIPFFSMFYATLGYLSDIYMHQAFAANHLNLIHCYVNPEILSATSFDFTDIDRIVVEILENNPDAHIVLKPCFRDCVPDWFIRQFPDELSRLDAGERLSRPSLASLEWRRVAGEALRQMIRHVKNSPYADKVIGYFVREGEEGQWMHYWGGDDLSKDNVFSDYSLPMKNFFAAWLKNKYGDEKSLREAWNDDKISFGSITIPSRPERLQSGKGIFRDPAHNRKAIDYAEALSDVISDGILYYAKIVKEETGRKALMMAFYGHVIDLGGSFMAEQVGYLKQRKVINSPDVDCLAGPIAYHELFRNIGGVASFDYPAPACLRLQNKIWLNEDDVRTHLKNPPEYAYSVRWPDQTNQVLAREFAKALCAGAGLYWLHLGSGKRNWFDDPQITQTIGQLNNIAQTAVTKDLSSVSQIAVVISDRSLLYLKPLQPRAPRDAIFTQCIFQREQIARIGAPFDEYLLDDFINPAMPDYKFYIFLNAFYLTTQEREAILKKLKKNNAAALWFYAPGFVHDNGLSTENIKELTGINLNMTEPGSEVRMQMVDSNSLKCRFTGDFGMPAGQTISPVFYPGQENFETLAIIKDANKPGLVKTLANGFTSYYCASPIIPAGILRTIAANAGVHIFTDSNDAVYACRNYLAVHTGNNAGARNLVLTENMQVRQVYPSGEEKAVELHNIKFYSETPQTRIFHIEERRK